MDGLSRARRINFVASRRKGNERSLAEIIIRERRKGRPSLSSKTVIFILSSSIPSTLPSKTIQRTKGSSTVSSRVFLEREYKNHSSPSRLSFPSYPREFIRIIRNLSRKCKKEEEVESQAFSNRNDRGLIRD